MVTVIIGTQWGDEGKGKIVDLLSEKMDFVVRFHGGNNAGHTVIARGKKYKFNLIPSGILHPNCVGIIANGTIVDLEVLASEIELIKSDGISLKDKLFISPKCHLILPYHKALDEAYENARGKNKLGTTKRGIGPAFSDKVSYNGIRVYELINWEVFEEKFVFQAEIKNRILQTFGVEPVNINAEIGKYKKLREKILPYVADTYELLKFANKSKKRILMEGAHGVMLDVDFGLYPFSTGSNVITGAVNTGSGIPTSEVKEVWAVVKAYTSRVGEGPLPTEIEGKLADDLREKGGEYGTVTNRPRRVGWLDLEAVKFACEVTGATHLAITKADVLSGLKELKVCTEYKLNGKKNDYSNCGYLELEKLEPIYRTFKGWDEDIVGVKKFSELPKTCQEYLHFIQKFLGVKIALVSTGPKREEYIKL